MAGDRNRIDSAGRDRRSPSALPAAAAVVLNWNGREKTLNCLRALSALDYPLLDVILIDNGCEEFSAAELEQYAERAHYLRTPVNLGFAGGANLGMEHALRRGAAWVWFLNNDTEPQPSALRRLVAAAGDDAAAGILGPKILRAADPPRIDSVALRIDLRWGRIYLLGHDEVDRGQYDGLRETRAVTGCAMLVSRAACEKLGGFDDRFFAYLEDADLCLRAAQAGFRVVVVPEARVHHARAAANEGRQSVASFYYTTRNQLVLIDRHSPAGIGRIFRRLAVIALNVAFALRPGSQSLTARLRAVRLGVADYRRGVFGGSWKG